MSLSVVGNGWVGFEYNPHLSVAAIGTSSLWTFRAEKFLVRLGQLLVQDMVALVGIACSVQKAQTQ